MILETIRMTSDWLKDATHGVNAELDALQAGVDMDATDPAMLAVAVIRNPTEDADAAAWQAPIELPAIDVREDGPVAADGEVATVYRDAASVALAIRYFATAAEEDVAVQQTMTALRAIVRSLAKFLQDTPEAEAARSRNGILILGCTTLTFGRWHEGVGDAKVTGAVGITLQVRDTLP